MRCKLCGKPITNLDNATSFSVEADVCHIACLASAYDRGVRKSKLLAKAYQAKDEEIDLFKKMHWAFATSSYSETQRWREKVASAGAKAADYYKQAMEVGE